MTKPKVVVMPGEDFKAKKPRLRKSDASNAAASGRSYIGQEVHGIVDGSFDAGYLVTVKVGDSPLVFRGLIFEPGMLAPLSKTNDIAPAIPATTRSQQVKLPASREAPPDTGGSSPKGEEVTNFATDEGPPETKEDEMEGTTTTVETPPVVGEVDIQQLDVHPAEGEREGYGLGDPDVSHSTEQSYLVESKSELLVNQCSSIMNLNVEVSESAAQDNANVEEQPSVS